MYGDQFGEFVCGYWGLKPVKSNIGNKFLPGIWGVRYSTVSARREWTREKPSSEEDYSNPITSQPPLRTHYDLSQAMSVFD